jgi:hypothetical protein
LLTGVHIEEQLRENAAGAAAGTGSFRQAGLRGSRTCLALFSACRALGLGFVRGAPQHVYAEDLGPAALDALGVYPVANASQAEVMLRRPLFPEAVFRACVLREGVPVADALQCWLDVSGHPVRGSEQAAEILAQLGLS